MEQSIQIAGLYVTKSDIALVAISSIDDFNHVIEITRNDGKVFKSPYYNSLTSVSRTVEMINAEFSDAIFRLPLGSRELYTEAVRPERAVAHELKGLDMEASGYSCFSLAAGEVNVRLRCEPYVTYSLEDAIKLRAHLDAAIKHSSETIS